MRIFISGGCKNGKSTLAQQLAYKNRPEGAPLYYIATMKPVDEEDNARIVRHISEREGMGFTTVEQPHNISQILKCCDTAGSFLLDSLTALLANEMFNDGRIHRQAGENTRGELLTILSQIDKIIIVSDFIYSDAQIYDSLTEEYRRSLAMLDRTCAGLCDVVLEVCAGSVTAHKGKEQYAQIV